MFYARRGTILMDKRIDTFVKGDGFKGNH